MSRLFALCLAFFGLQRAIAQGTVVLTTRDGQLRGAERAGIATFQGIPYAAPPIGMLRWRPPLAPAHWSGERDATLAGPDCPQPPNPGALSPSGQSEDCLTLSVWTPIVRAQRPLPVLVWIHGGAFLMGGTASVPENGENLARKGLVVVTMNYRLGRLGWFAHPSLTAEAKHRPTADFGLMDQIAALRWVQKNIVFFGGDPHRVTLAGESGGGWSTGLLMAAPSARGLFAQAIVESGFGRQSAIPLQEAERTGQAFAAAHGATDLADLRHLPTSAFIEVSAKDVDPTQFVGPVLDGSLLPVDEPIVFNRLSQARVPLLIGSNSCDGTLFPQLIAHPETELFPKIPRLFRKLLPMVYGRLPAQTLAADLLTDKVFAEPARYIARKQREADLPAYRYVFDYTSGVNGDRMCGAAHADEVPYVFGNLPAGASPRDREVSSQMMAYWVNYISLGNANGAGNPTWSGQGEPTLVFGEHSTISEPDYHRLRLDFVGRWMKRTFVALLMTAALGILILALSLGCWLRQHRVRRSAS